MAEPLYCVTAVGGPALAMHSHLPSWHKKSNQRKKINQFLPDV